jgi:transposase
MPTPSTTIPLIGLDIGKNVHVYGTYRAEDLEPLGDPVKIHNNRAGFTQFAAHVDNLLARYAVVRVANEPTGIYYEAFGRQVLTYFAEPLAAGHLVYQLVNPHLVKEARTALQRGRVRKTDAIDTQAIARCLQQGTVMPARFPDEHVLRFQQWARRFRRNQIDMRRLRNQIILQMDRLWPGAFVNVQRFKHLHPDLEPPVPLVETRPLERKLVQAILTHCPNPYDALLFTVDEMVELLRASIGRAGVNTARKVLRNVRQSLLPPEEVAAILTDGLTHDWQRFQACLALDSQLEAEACLLLPGSPAEVLVSVPGMSPYHAARYLAGIGEVERFSAADHIWAFAGFDPVLVQSGDTRRLGQISKRGDPAFRDTLYRIGHSLSRHCPPVTAAFQRAFRGHPRRRVLATLHAAHKANRLLYHLLLHQERYSPAQHR